MNRLKKMQPILELAERKQTDAVQRFGMGQQKLAAARSNLQHLQGYRENYSSRFQDSGQQGMSMQQLTEYRAFLSKINKAVADQERAVTLAEAELENLRANWEDAHRHLLGIQKVVEKLTQAEIAKEQKREQLEQDDRAGNRRSGGHKGTLAVFL
jgi:flagellar FliJ protein